MGKKKIMQNKLEKILQEDGYRFFFEQEENTKVYYKYYQEGFHVVLLPDFTEKCGISVEGQYRLEENIKGKFFHPQGNLTDFPEGFPVYHVEVLTLILGENAEQLRTLCVQCRNTWGYDTTTEKLLIYENQPGEFWGLRKKIENLQTTDVGSSRKFPYITLLLAAINVGVFLVMEIMGDTEDGLFIAEHGGMHPNFILYSGQWWRILTAGFIHFGMEHLLNNMLTFYFLGSKLEEELGHWRMLAVYLISEIGGGLMSYHMMLRTQEYAISAGASGAVFGVIGGVLWIVIRNKGKLEGLTAKNLVLMILLSLYLGFAESGVDNWAHIGGMVTGFVVTAILYHKRWQKS